MRTSAKMYKVIEDSILSVTHKRIHLLKDTKLHWPKNSHVTSQVIVKNTSSTPRQKQPKKY